jgi:hypothetical protein
VSDFAAVPVDAAPFDLGDGRDAALCLHGLTGTPYEIRPIGEALAAAGVRAIGPLLPGTVERTGARARAPHRLDDATRVRIARCARATSACTPSASLGGLPHSATRRRPTSTRSS